MFRKKSDPTQDAYLNSFRAKSLRELETQQTIYKRGIEDAEREIKLLDAQINGLKMQRPAGFGARVEELEASRAKRKALIDLQKKQLASIRQVIAEKSPRRPW